MEQQNPIERLPDWQCEALQNAVLCAAQQGKVLSEVDVENIAYALNRLNRAANPD